MAVAPTNLLMDEILDFLASTPTPEQIIAYRPSDVLAQRLHDLLDQNRLGTLTSIQQDELDEFIRMNHFMNMLKIRARQKLATS
jgi:hypothetical protein